MSRRRVRKNCRAFALAMERQGVRYGVALKTARREYEKDRAAKRRAEKSVTS